MKELNITGGGITSLLENALLSAGSVIKSVQNGQTYAYLHQGNNPTSPERTVTTNISEVDPKKSLLIYVAAPASTAYSAGPAYATLEKSRIVFSSKINIAACYFTWQVIEFY